MAIPGFTAEQSLRAFQLRDHLRNTRAAGAQVRLRMMQSSETGQGITYDLAGQDPGSGAGGDGGVDGGVAAGPDGGTPDGGTPDAGRTDGGTPDAGRDAGSSGSADAGSSPDAGSGDVYVPRVRVRCYELQNDGSVVEVPCPPKPNEI
jgi:hypothetical protein